MKDSVILKGKKRAFTEAVQEMCDSQNLPLPEINFNGCSAESGDQLAHSHPELYKICISDRQLKLQSSVGLKETAYHEMTHLIGLIEHGREFEDKKNQLISKGWKPRKGTGIVFISGKEVNESNKEIRENPERSKRVDEDSDYVKFLEGRPLNKNKIEEGNLDRPKEVHKIKEQTPIKKAQAQSKRNIESKKKGKSIKPKLSTTYKPMGKKEIEESRKKLNIHTNEEVNEKPKTTLESKHILTKEEQEQLTDNAYKNMDTGFGDSHGENRWNKKKKGLFRRLKDALGID